MPYLLVNHCLLELNSSPCFCWFSCSLFPLPFLFTASQPLAQQSSSFPMLWLKLPLVSTVLYQEYFVLSSKGKTQFFHAGLRSPCWEFLFWHNNGLPKEGSWKGTLTSPVLCKAMASLGLVWCPLCVHPLDLFAFICTVGNCKNFMRAITDKVSQEMIPGGLCCFQFGRFASLSLLANMLHQACGFGFLSFNSV